MKYLKKHKYKIIERNFETRYGEIDIICKNKECLCFVEVKTRTVGEKELLFRPAKAVTPDKRRDIISAAKIYEAFRRREGKKFRFDVAEVTVFEKQDGTTGYKLNYITNAF